MSNKVWSVVKFKIKSGCEEEFLAAHNFSEDHMAHFWPFRAFQIDENLIAHIAEYESLDKAFDAQDQGLDWLYSVEHLLEYYEDQRTEAFSGLEIYSHSK